jgi:uncharacterized membrane protein
MAGKSFSSIFRWVARGLAVVLTLVFVIFVLAEPLETFREMHFRETAGMLFLLLAIVAMMLAWRWELPGALIALFALGAFAALSHVNRYHMLAVGASPSMLYLVDWKLRHLPGQPSVT